MPNGISDAEVPEVRKLLHDVNDELSIAVLQLEMMLEVGLDRGAVARIARRVARRLPQGGRQPEAGLDHPRPAAPAMKHSPRRRDRRGARRGDRACPVDAGAGGGADQAAHDERSARRDDRGGLAAARPGEHAVPAAAGRSRRDRAGAGVRAAARGQPAHAGAAEVFRRPGDHPLAGQFRRAVGRSRTAQRPLGAAQAKVAPEFTVRLAPAMPFEPIPRPRRLCTRGRLQPGLPGRLATRRVARRGSRTATAWSAPAAATSPTAATAPNSTSSPDTRRASSTATSRWSAASCRAWNCCRRCRAARVRWGSTRSPNSTCPSTSIRLAADLPRSRARAARGAAHRHRQFPRPRRGEAQPPGRLVSRSGGLRRCLQRTDRRAHAALSDEAPREAEHQIGGMTMDRFWLKHYPPGVPHDVDVSQYSSLVQLLDEGFRKHAARNAYAYMDKFFTFADVDRYSAAFGAWLQSRGPRPRRARRDHDAQRRAVPDRGRRRAARGIRRRQRESAVHAARTRTPAQGLGRRGDRDPRELRRDAAAGHREVPP